MNLPNFFCAGAPKSGTTTLYDILKKHPQVALSSHKEPLFFNIDSLYFKGIQWYLDTYFSQVKDEIVVGDFTPTYLASPAVPQRIKENLGTDIKFIFILRNPVDRAYSHYLHNKRDQRESLDFEEALTQEKQRELSFLKSGDYLSALKFGYVKHSLYAKSLQNYFRGFPSSNIKIFIYEEFFEDVGSHIQQILKFLGIDENIRLQTEIKSNPSSVAKSEHLKKLLVKESGLKKFIKAIVPSTLFRRKLRNYLQAMNNKPSEYAKLDKVIKKKIYETYFKEDTKELEKLLNRHLNIWGNY